MNALPKYVLTHGKKTTGWTNSHAVTTPEVVRLKRGSRRLWLFTREQARRRP